MAEAERITTRKIVLELDAKDYEHVMGAMKRRDRMGHPHAVKDHPIWVDEDDPLLPDGEGNIEGRLIAEICRGWAEAITGWDWINGEPMDPDIAASITPESAEQATPADEDAP